MLARSGVRRNRAGLALILVAYFCVALSMLKEFRYAIHPDEVSYISIAQKYLRGDFAEAVNGLWSPVVSWLALPLLRMAVPPVLSFAVMSVLVGALTLVGVDLTMSVVGIRNKVRFLYGLSLVPLMAWYALNDGNPDLLSLCVLLFYLYVVLRDDYRTDGRRGVAAGLLGALAYLTKAYNFYFFVLHFTCLTLLYWYNASADSERRIVLRNAVGALGVFALVSSLWIGLLAHKYHKVTVSTAGEYNFSCIRPDSPGQPVDTQGLLPLPNQTAVSAWEDPTRIPHAPWNPFASPDDLLHFARNAAKNSVDYLYIVSRNPVFSVTIVYFLMSLIPFRLKIVRSPPLLLFLTALMQPLGYLIVHVEERYLWLSFVLLYILAAYLLDLALEKADVVRGKKILLVAVTCGYTALVPSLFLWRHIGSEEYAAMKRIHSLSEEMKSYKDFRGKNIASQVEDWCDDLHLAYYLDARYYGKVEKGISNQKLRKELLDYKIDYYFVHGEPRNRVDILEPERRFEGLTVYRVVNR